MSTSENTTWYQAKKAPFEAFGILYYPLFAHRADLEGVELGDADMADAVTEEVPTMEGIISTLKEYDNSANAIGYSVYYYASMMFSQPDLKFLAVEGTEPSSCPLTLWVRSSQKPLIAFTPDWNCS